MNMENNQTFITVEAAELTDKIVRLKAEGYRLVQMSCTTTDGFDIIYGFDKDGDLLSYRINISKDTEITSISSIFFPAFLYENEMKDLFGVKIRDIALDYQGKFYKLAKKTPFNPCADGDCEAKSE
jgi:ech hydrogenase subunit D